MKKTIITLTMVCFAIAFSFGQSKGDNFIGLNFGTQKVKTELPNSSYENKYKSIGVNYSFFTQDNRRLKLGVSFNDATSSNSSGNSDIKGYGINLGYGILFPLLKNFYAELSPGIIYNYRKEGAPNTIEYRNYYYSVNLYGGVLWVPFKHFGLSANIASLNLSFNKSKTYESSIDQKSTSTSFSLDSQESLGNQSFSIFYKF